MNAIKKVLGENKSVWLYLEDDTAKCKFVEEITQMGAKFLNGDPVTTQSCSTIMSVHSDNRIAHVSIMAWTSSFRTDAGILFNREKLPARIDYKKLLDGTDYYCSHSMFEPVVILQE